MSKLIKAFGSLDRKFLFFLILSPAIIWILLKPGDFFSEWRKVPSYSKVNLSLFFAPDRLTKTEETRWNAFGEGREDILSRIYYNKGYVLVDNFFSYTSFFSPRFFFQSGDGSPLSPPGVEPIAIPLFGLFVLGALSLLRERQYLLLYLIPLLSLPAFLAGRRNIALLLPVLLIYLAISYLGLKKINNKSVWLALGIYGVFLLGRVFLLK